jgi:hypothetical protein
MFLFQENKSYGIKKPFALILCLQMGLSQTNLSLFLLSRQMFVTVKLCLMEVSTVSLITLRLPDGFNVFFFVIFKQKTQRRPRFYCELFPGVVMRSSSDIKERNLFTCNLVNTPQEYSEFEIRYSYLT